MIPRAAVLAALVLAAAAPARADEAEKAQLSELNRKVDALTQEIERLKLGDASAPPELKAQNGLGPERPRARGRQDLRRAAGQALARRLR
jgi:hypothetical protein